MRSPNRKLLLCAISSALLAACGSGGYAPGGLRTVAGPPASSRAPAPTASSTVATAARPAVAVSMRNLAFTPQRTTATVGQSIEWINRDDVAHNVTTLDGSTIASADLRPGGRFAYVPARAGRLRYYCTIHPSTMSGELVVLAG